MAEKNRTCIICGEKYTWCNNCSDNKNKHETWRNLYCSKNCMNIFNILSDHAFKHIDDQQAKEKLKNVDLSKLDGFRADFKEQIKKIQANQNQQPQSQPQQQPKQNQSVPEKQNQDKQPNKEIVKENFKK